MEVWCGGGTLAELELGNGGEWWRYMFNGGLLIQVWDLCKMWVLVKKSFKEDQMS